MPEGESCDIEVSDDDDESESSIASDQSRSINSLQKKREKKAIQKKFRDYCKNGYKPYGK